MTRPAAQADGLCDRIAAAGGRPIRLPVLAIAPAPDPTSLRPLLAEDWDLLVFVSRNAVEQALPLFPDQRLPTASRLVAVGQATAQALVAAGRAPDLVPSERYDSEALLAFPALADLRGQRVLIVRGDGGRALLGETLAARGAEVVFAEVYRRILPAISVERVVSDWRQDVAIAIATSDEVLRNLITLARPVVGDDLFQTPLVVVAERTRGLALALGFVHVAVAARADEASLVAACEALVAAETA
ncbi:uroporphyrinogen-III synthase [Thioalkalicoccus limnaeus]|uniref:uroporphyrinogen-III synthase n=1 Tax=Thioalkalicoccus limnaeus TaxID=120681 RepID=UPI0034E97DFA